MDGLREEVPTPGRERPVSGVEKVRVGRGLCFGTAVSSRKWRGERGIVGDHVKHF